MHAREQIRSAVATALTGLSATGSNVFMTRLHKFQATELPALAIYTLQEEVERATMGSRSQERALHVAVDIAIQQVSNVDSALDDISADVEDAMETAWQAGSGIWGTILDLTLNSSVVTMSGEGDQRALGMVLTYTVLYRTVEGEPETIIA